MRPPQEVLPPLCDAASKGHVPVGEALIAAGADVSKASQHGTPLHAAMTWAPQGSKVAVERLLRQAGATA